MEGETTPTVPPTPQPVGPSEPVPTPPPPTEPVGPTEPTSPVAPVAPPPSTEPVGEDDRPPAGDAASPGGRRALLAAAGVLGLVVVVLGAFLLGQRADREDPPAQAPATTPTSAVPGTVPADFVTYTDPEAGFTLKHPKTWRKVATEELSLPEGTTPPNLVVTPGGLDYVSVRVSELEGTVGPDNIGDLQAVTDAIISDADVRVLERRSVTVNGMQGYYYLYIFTDTATKQEGLHSHYFLFQGKKMHALVFQAVPAEAIRRLEPTFDAIRDSFESKPQAG